MTFVTKLTLKSGDRTALDAVVEDIRELARRKGAQFKGPHSEAPTELFVPLHRRLDDAGGEFGTWRYTVYTRHLELVGHDDLARRILETGFPDSVQVEVEVEQRRTAKGR